MNKLWPPRERADGTRFRCVACHKWKPAKDDADDDLPYHCDACWAAAHDARAAGIGGWSLLHDVGPTRDASIIAEVRELLNDDGDGSLAAPIESMLLDLDALRATLARTEAAAQALLSNGNALASWVESEWEGCALDHGALCAAREWRDAANAWRARDVAAAVAEERDTWHDALGAVADEYAAKLAPTGETGGRGGGGNG